MFAKTSYCTHITCIKLVRVYGVKVFSEIVVSYYISNFCLYLVFRSTSIDTIVKYKHSSLTSCKKNNFPTNQDTSEVPEALVLDLSTGRIHWCEDPSLFGHVSSIFIFLQKMKVELGSLH